MDPPYPIILPNDGHPPLMDYVPMGMNGPPPQEFGQQPCRQCGGDGYVYAFRLRFWFVPWLVRERCGRCIHVMEKNRDGLWIDPEQISHRPAQGAIFPPPPPRVKTLTRIDMNPIQVDCW